MRVAQIAMTSSTKMLYEIKSSNPGIAELAATQKTFLQHKILQNL
jgi:hypothetical protein